MQCPSDGTVLVMSERSGVEIDYCPTCRGVWLDRGELDKILERAGREFGAPQSAPTAPSSPAPPAYSQQQSYDNRGYDNRGYDNRGYGDQGYRKKKKESWLSDLFD
ncbi:zf-TFIIB domain-containing protein [Agromyces neolithicus]|uniref:Zf-TFIIB domain-containing protein n=1 Tax=Agromyces neolithicus TaxID=269420 RepID=A0ABP4YFR2_9MICO